MKHQSFVEKFIILYTDLTVSSCVLSVSSFPLDADPMRDSEVSLQCSLVTFFGRCKLNSIRWVDETGTVLDGEDADYKFLNQSNCVSYLHVKRQSGHNRKYTCQFIDQGQIWTEAEYTPVFTGDTGEDQPEKPDSGKIICSQSDTKLACWFLKVWHVGV